MDVVDVEENVNEVSMDEVSVGCDPEYEDYGTVGTNDADKAENAECQREHRAKIKQM
jgi:hypothetical protein